MNDYYVYAHYVSGSIDPFYIGKGKCKRAWSKTGHNQYWNRIVNKHNYEVKLLHENLSEVDAHEIETGLIEKYGRRNINTGCLVNMTCGGEGASGIIQTDAQKQKRIDSNKETWNQPHKKTQRSLESKALWQNPEFKEKTQTSIKEAYKNPELRKLRSEIAKNSWSNPETREKLLSSIKEAKSREGYKEFISEKIKDGWTEEHRKIRSEQMKNRWKDPEFKKMMLERRKQKRLDKQE
jgi:hypothetical protein